MAANAFATTLHPGGGAAGGPSDEKLLHQGLMASTASGADAGQDPFISSAKSFLWLPVSPCCEDDLQVPPNLVCCAARDRGTAGVVLLPLHRPPEGSEGVCSGSFSGDLLQLEDDGALRPLQP